MKYLKYDASEDEESNRMRTYMIRDSVTDEFVSYFSLKAGLVSLNEEEVEIVDWDSGKSKTVREFDTLPGIELG